MGPILPGSMTRPSFEVRDMSRAELPNFRTSIGEEVKSSQLKGRTSASRLGFNCRMKLFCFRHRSRNSSRDPIPSISDVGVFLSNNLNP
ncbi:unnamed protein product [Protopolystoma xenopodis]|uniref:Uncharacterized protein n=1 Tax=Protopolystoma xenopodis TaxID=117903 RepID=A0A3S4ZGK1_9PLAT|nr:unnamed protein product [Protopolystoma xenopodis]